MGLRAYCVLVITDGKSGIVSNATYQPGAGPVYRFISALSESAMVEPNLRGASSRYSRQVTRAVERRSQTVETMGSQVSDVSYGAL